MSDLLTKCKVCLSLIDEEDLFCANCGTEAPRRKKEPQAVADAARTATHNFDCSGCGASMSFDAAAGSLQCPLGSVFLGQRRSESDHQLNAGQVKDRALILVDNAHHRCEVLVQHLDDGVGGERCRELGKASQIGKEHNHILALASLQQPSLLGKDAIYQAGTDISLEHLPE